MATPRGCRAGRASSRSCRRATRPTTIAESIGSLLRQDYPGAFTVILVDDDSSDGTAEIARRAAARWTRGPPARRDEPAAAAGLDRQAVGGEAGHRRGATAMPQPPDYLLLTDADIVHAPDSVRRLVARARGRRPGAHLADGEAALRELRRARLIPAFIFFFQMLYPFAWVNRPRHATSRPRPAAACWCARMRCARPAASRSIRNALIDDCALAQALKAHGPIWLGLTERVHSIRPYPDFADIRRMVSRSAYAQLRYSPLLLAGTVAGMALTYLAPPLLALFGSWRRARRRPSSPGC